MDLLSTLTKIRETKTLQLPPGVEKYWTDNPEFKLRPYQIQMVWNMILCPSFLCGDSPGLGKCVEGSTLVWTEKGLLPIKSLAPRGSEVGKYYPINLKVQTDSGVDLATHIYVSGQQPTKRVTLYNGVVLEGTYHHPVRIIDQCGSYVWKTLGDLDLKDTLCFSTQDFSFETPVTPLPKLRRQKVLASPVEVPAYATPELALFLGLLIGDGYIGPTGFDLTSHIDDTDIQYSFIQLCKSLFGVSVTFKVGTASRPTVMSGAVHSRDLSRWLLEDIGIVNSDGYKVVPKCILSGGPVLWKPFLAGLLATDGHITKDGRFEITFKSEPLIRGVQQLFMALGVTSKLTRKIVKPRPGNGGGSYLRLDLAGYGLNKLPDIFRMCPSARKLARLRSNWNQGRNPSRLGSYQYLYNRVKNLMSSCTKTTRLGGGKEIKPLFFAKLYTDIHMSHHKFAEQKHANRWDVKRLNTQQFEDLEDLNWIYTNVLPISISSITDSSSFCYDLVVPNSHTFIANGIISHNTAMGSATVSAIKASHPDAKFLVYTTSSAQRQWCEEVLKFTTLKARTLNEKEKGLKTADARKYDFQRFLTDDSDILIIRYSTLLADGEFQVGAIPYFQKKVCLILDEASAFKSSNTETHKIIQRLSSVCTWKYGMSATPIENHLTEIRNIFQALGIDALGTDEWFRYRYCEEETQGYRSRWKYVNGKSKLVKEPITITTGYKNLNELKELLAPYFWARAQSEVGEQLPLLNTHVIPVPMNPLQKKKTDDIWAGLVTIEHLDPADGITEEFKVVDSKMTVLMLHQLVSINPSLLSDRSEDYIPAPTTPKEDTLIELLNTTLQGSKCIVYTRFRRELERLKHILPEATGRNVLYVHGDMDKDERYLMMQKFQNDPNETLICINQSAFQAVNLQQAENMICLDLPWAWGGMLQLIGRMVRLRSPHSICNLFILKTINTIDDHVIALLKNKKGIFERILSPSASLGVFDETEHEPFTDSGNNGFVSKLFDTLTLSRHSYRQRCLDLSL